MNNTLEKIATLIDNCFTKQTNRHRPIFELTDKELQKVRLIFKNDDKLTLLKNKHFTNYQSFFTSPDNINLSMIESPSPTFKEKFQINCLKKYMSLIKNNHYQMLYLKNETTYYIYVIDVTNNNETHIHYYFVLK